VARCSICYLAADTAVVVGIDFRCLQARAVRFEVEAGVRAALGSEWLNRMVLEEVQEGSRGSMRSRRECTTCRFRGEVEDGRRRDKFGGTLSFAARRRAASATPIRHCLFSLRVLLSTHFAQTTDHHGPTRSHAMTSSLAMRRRKRKALRP
jgi:hypothetical protein